MDVIGQQVQHHKFGEGHITNQNETNITVQFSEEYGTKKFAFPGAFEEHLILDDSALHKSVTKIIVQIRKKEETARKRREEEMEKRQEEQRLAALESKRASTKKRAPTKKQTIEKKQVTEKKQVAEKKPASAKKEKKE